MEAGMSFIANLRDCEAKLGTYVSSGADAGSKECVAAVKALAGAPATFAWRRGERVKGNLLVMPGTAIATFPLTRNTHFGFKGHAAILIRHTAAGFEVYDQWNGTPLHRREITSSCAGYVSNDAEAFYVVELTEHPSDDPALCGSSSHY
jgi:hypothetical protein